MPPNTHAFHAPSFPSPLPSQAATLHLYPHIGPCAAHTRILFVPFEPDRRKTDSPQEGRLLTTPPPPLLPLYFVPDLYLLLQTCHLPCHALPGHALVLPALQTTPLVSSNAVAQITFQSPYPMPPCLFPFYPLSPSLYTGPFIYTYLPNPSFFLPCVLLPAVTAPPHPHPTRATWTLCLNFLDLTYLPRDPAPHLPFCCHHTCTHMRCTQAPPHMPCTCPLPSCLLMYTHWG